MQLILNCELLSDCVKAFQRRVVDKYKSLDSISWGFGNESYENVE